MRWFVANWRLKLLALALTLGLLGAVAFSENPVTAVGVPASVDYERTPKDLVVLNPTLLTTINLVGLTSVTNPLRNPNISNGIHVRVDLGNLQAPDHVRQVTLNATPKSLPSGVSWTGDPIIVTISVDKLATKTFKIDAAAVRHPKVAPGFKVLDTDAKGNPATFGDCGNNQPCQVDVTGPESLLGGLTAYVQIDDQITGNEQSSNQPVRFEQGGKPFDLKSYSSVPAVSVLPSVVVVQVTVQQSQVTRQVALKATVAGRPACGYAVSGISFTPDSFVTITGAADKIAPVDSITLPRGIDITGATSDVRSNQNIPSDNYTPNPTSVTVTISISKQVDCTAPTPTPIPTPKPT